MKCEHCGYEAPERAVICPECGEILPRPQKEESSETEKSADNASPKTANVPETDSFSMPFLSAPAVQGDSFSDAAEDPEIQKRAKQEKHFRRVRRIVALVIAAVLLALVILYTVFFRGYRLAAFRYVKGMDYCSGSMYTALVPDAYMDHIEDTYSTTRREVKSMMHDYFTYWNENEGTDGRMSYTMKNVTTVTDEESLAELESTLKTDYSITVDVRKAVEGTIVIDDGGSKNSEDITFVKIGSRWCCVNAMYLIDYVCQYDGYDIW